MLLGKCFTIISFASGVTGHRYFTFFNYQLSIFYFKYNICKILADVCEISCCHTHVVRACICSAHFICSAELEIFLRVQLVADINYFVAFNSLLASVIFELIVVTFDLNCNFICYRCYFQCSFFCCDIVVVGFCAFVQLVSKCIVAFTYICTASGYVICCTFACRESVSANSYFIVLQCCSVINLLV